MRVDSGANGQGAGGPRIDGTSDIPEIRVPGGPLKPIGA